SHTNRVVLTTAAGQAANFENVNGGAGNDSITGNAASNSLTGNSGTDSLSGSSGNDTLTGGEGNDVMLGGTGNDIYSFSNATAAQTDMVIENASEGTDRLDFSSASNAVTVNLASATTTVATMTNRVVNTGSTPQNANFENAYGGSGSDTITG